jgi:CheY-like chemotaxis protein
VLLVEDEPAVRQVARVMLTRLGFTVLEAADGQGAVELFRQHQAVIRCVLCDLTMPGLDGWETLAALREMAPAIPAVLASGYDRTEVLSGEHPAWPQAFLSKPYQMADLRDALARCLDRTGAAA